MRINKKLSSRFLRKIIFGFSLFLLVFGLVVFLNSDFLEVQKVVCQMEQNPCSAEIWMELMSLTVGKNIIFLSTKKLVSQIEESNLLLKEVEIKKGFPNRLSFKLKKREPQATVKSSEGKGFLVVDEEGFLLEKVNETKLSVILVEQKINLNVGEKIVEKEIIWAVNLLKYLKLRSLMSKTAKIVSPRQIEVELDDGLSVIFSSLKEVDFQLDSLQLIFSRSKIEGRNLKQIDLRFDKAVVIYE